MIQVLSLQGDTQVEQLFINGDPKIVSCTSCFPSAHESLMSLWSFGRHICRCSSRKRSIVTCLCSAWIWSWYSSSWGLSCWSTMLQMEWKSRWIFKLQATEPPVQNMTNISSIDIQNDTMTFDQKSNAPVHHSFSGGKTRYQRGCSGRNSYLTRHLKKADSPEI